ncbi:hypothetical protein GCM10018773_30590 [Streptomyces candidus]|nr:hypothetical protein GCM10018773_30590 [Streptomyces candidus]
MLSLAACEQQPTAGQHLPRGAGMRTFSRADLDAVAHKLNRRPRKNDDYRTPAEVYADLLSSGGELTT